MARVEITEVEGLTAELERLREEIALKDNGGWLCGARDIAVYLGVPAETLYNMRQQGRLAGVVGQDNPPHGKLVAEKRVLDTWRRDSAEWLLNGGHK